MRSSELMCLILAAGLTLVGCGSSESGFARAKRMERLDEGVGGPKAMARPGDIILENQHLRVAILASTRADGTTRTSFGPALFGGTLADADLQRSDPRFGQGRGRDQFAELFATTSLNVPAPTTENDVRIVSDGSDGGPAVVRVEGKGEPFLSLLSALWALTDVPDMRMVTDYIVEPGVPWITMRTAVRVGPTTNASDFGGQFPTGDPVQPHTESFPLIERAVEDGLIMGDFFLVGGSVSVFAPGMGFDEDGLVFRANEAGLNTFTSPFQFPWVAGNGEGVSYGMMAADGDLFVPLFTSSQTTLVGGSAQGDAEADDRFRDGAVFEYERYFFVGHGDAGSIFDQVIQARGLESGQLTGQVVEESTGIPVSGAHVFAFEPGAEYPFNQWETDVRLEDDVDDGSFAGRLPVGTWELLVHQEGRPPSERVTVTVEADSEQSVVLTAERGGLFTFTIVDETGEPMPGKVTFYREDGISGRRPELGDGFIAGSPESVVFPMYGEGEVQLPDGEYTAVASRGLEYELDTAGPFLIDRGRSHHFDFVLERSIDTEGWISADFHVHADPSHDVGVVLVDRVRSMVCEGVEFFSSTDHDVITDFAPTVEALGMQRFVQTAVGVETTTVEIGHFLGFPLQGDFLEESGGAMDWTGLTPIEIVSSLRSQGAAGGYDPLVFVAHPRSGLQGYFDQYGMNPYKGQPGFGGAVGEPSVRTPTLAFTNSLLRTENMDFDFDAMEIMSEKVLMRIRTPTAPEIEKHAEFLATGDPSKEVTFADILERTPEEQQALTDGTYTLGWGHEGQVDDWFTMLNLGYRFTALANSDTHSMTTTEAGCPRNYVMVGADDPQFLDDQEVADAVKKHRVVASYGPFVQLSVGGATIGDELVSSDAVLPVEVSVQAPSWMDVDRVELYENGTLIHSWLVDGDAPDRFTGTHDITPSADAWYVAIAVGNESLEPVFTPVERPIIDLQVVVTSALAGVPAVGSFLDPAVPLPETFDVTPYAVTNPIWLDRDGDGFDAPGVPEWMVEPEEPEEG